MNQDLTKDDSHFAFGENWASYATLISEQEIGEAVQALERTVGQNGLRGKRFLDIGSGSGIHSLAALRLGVAKVVAIDLDPQSVATTRSVLRDYIAHGRVDVQQMSVLDLKPDVWGQFEIVYSWGVLHHTGNLELALRKAAALVKEGGHFVCALYRKTWMCPFWKIEKRWYSKASPHAQEKARRLYLRWFRLVGGRFFDVDLYIAEYRRNRGMDFIHDVHDWLGGYPYESILPDDVDLLMQKCGLVRSPRCTANIKRGRDHGLLGSRCDEYLYMNTRSEGITTHFAHRP